MKLEDDFLHLNGEKITYGKINKNFLGPSKNVIISIIGFTLFQVGQ